MPHEIKLKTENITLDLCCNSLSKRYRLAISYVRLSCTIQRIVQTLLNKRNYDFPSLKLRTLNLVFILIKMIQTGYLFCSWSG